MCSFSLFMNPCTCFIIILARSGNIICKYKKAVCTCASIDALDDRFDGGELDSPPTLNISANLSEHPKGFRID